MTENVIKKKAVWLECNDLLYSHPHGWAPVGDIEKLLKKNGFSIKTLERHNKTDGEYRKQFNKDGNSFELSANQWDAPSFQPLIEWIKSIKTKTGRPLIDINKYSARIIELRTAGNYLEAIGKELSISRPTIISWLAKGKEAGEQENSEKNRYFLFFTAFTRAAVEAGISDLDLFDQEIKEMGPDQEKHNKYMDIKSRVKERRNRLNGGGNVNVQVNIKQKFTGW